jgi:hypothetical protein
MVNKIHQERDKYSIVQHFDQVCSFLLPHSTSKKTQEDNMCVMVWNGIVSLMRMILHRISSIPSSFYTLRLPQRRNNSCLVIFTNYIQPPISDFILLAARCLIKIQRIFQKYRPHGSLFKRQSKKQSSREIHLSQRHNPTWKSEPFYTIRQSLPFTDRTHSLFLLTVP